MLGFHALLNLNLPDCIVQLKFSHNQYACSDQVTQAAILIISNYLSNANIMSMLDIVHCLALLSP
jgi:hypothetical protein